MAGSENGHNILFGTLLRREQYAQAVDQLEAGAYGYLVSRTALLHPRGETFDVSMGLRGFFEALTRIAAQPDKDFGELVRQRRRKRGLPVAPAGKVLPFFPVPIREALEQLKAVDFAAEAVLQGTTPPDDLGAARLLLAEQRLREAFIDLEAAERHLDAQPNLNRLGSIYDQAVVAYESLYQGRQTRS